MISNSLQARIRSQGVKQGRVKHILSRDVSHILMVCHGLVMVRIPLIRRLLLRNFKYLFFCHEIIILRRCYNYFYKHVHPGIFIWRKSVCMYYVSSMWIVTCSQCVGFRACFWLSLVQCSSVDLHLKLNKGILEGTPEVERILRSSLCLTETKRLDQRVLPWAAIYFLSYEELREE